MIAKDRSWNRTALNFHMRNDWQFYRNGTAAKARHIIDDCNLFLFVMIKHKNNPFCSLHKSSIEKNLLFENSQNIKN
jgi:hypothetical protein